jgi:hypothetical protein
VPNEIINQHKLAEKVNLDGYVYIEVQKGMCGLPQEGILAQQMLEKRLNAHRYSQSKSVPGLWMHTTCLISFSLVVDNSGIKYVGKEHVLHLLDVLKQHYGLSEDWSGTNFIGLTFDWDYAGWKVHISMPRYISKALT